MATTRLDMRLDEQIKVAAARAAALKGMKRFTEFVVQVIQQDSARVINDHESIKLNNDIFDRFTTACEQAEAPNGALREAIAYSERRGIR